MEAKDTVIKTEPHSATASCPHCGEELGQGSLVESIRSEQAEITWLIAEREGMRKVVEHLKTDKDIGFLMQVYFDFKGRAKLKEWGLTKE